MTVDRASERPPWAWRAFVGVVMWLLRRVMGWRVRVDHADPVAADDRPLVGVFNHTSAIDGFVVADAVRHRLGRWCQPLVKSEIFELPIIGALAHRAGAVPVVRDEDAGREAAYGDAVARLRAGGTVLVAPEGTITHDGSLLPLRHGAARLALEAGVDVLVVTHFGAQRAFSPVGRSPDRGAVVLMTMDVISPWPDDDAASLTGRMAATMLDRSEQLRSTYPQQDPDAPWWPPYAAPASPSATARESIERYRQSMAETVADARDRMRHMAEERDLEERVSKAREHAVAAVEELASLSRDRAGSIADQARAKVDELATLVRERVDDPGDGANERVPEVGDPDDAAGLSRADTSASQGAAPHDDVAADADPEADDGESERDHRSA